MHSTGIGFSRLLSALSFSDLVVLDGFLFLWFWGGFKF